MPPMSAFEARKARLAARGKGTLDATVAKDRVNGPKETPLNATKKRGPSLPPKRTPKKPRTRVPDNESPMDNQTGSYSTSLSGMDTGNDTEEDSDAIEVSSEKAYRQLSTLASPVRMRELGKGAIHQILQPGDQLTLIGVYKIWVKNGCVSIMGALISASSKSYMVFAPSTHALPAIKHVKLPLANQTHAEIIIESVYPGLRGLGRLSLSYKALWNQQDGMSKSFAYLANSDDDPKGRVLHPLLEPGAWDTVTSSIARRAQEAPVVFIYGPQNCGKSSFARQLINRLLTIPKSDFLRNSGLDFVDLDPGQPEYSPPGQISLMRVSELNLGPPYTHPVPCERNRLVRAHFLGDITPANDVEHYLSCAADLFARRDPNLPLIINGCGWIRDMGLEVMEKVVRGVRLTDIVMFSNTYSTSSPSNLDQMVQRIAYSATVHPLMFQRHKGHSARDLREMQAMSYFHSDFRCEGAFHLPSWEYQHPLLRDPVDPGMQLCWGGARPDFRGVIVSDNRIEPSTLPMIIDGNVCALVVVEDASLDAKISQEDDHDIPYLFLGNGAACEPIDPGKSHCLGQVFIRRIDERKKTLHVMTPLSKESLTKHHTAGHTLVLVYGRLKQPGWAYLEIPVERETRKKERAAWNAFRRKEIENAGGTVSSDGTIWGPNGEDWTLQYEADFLHDDDFDSDEGDDPFIEVESESDSNDSRTNTQKAAWKAGNKVWKVRRNLEVDDDQDA